MTNSADDDVSSLQPRSPQSLSWHGSVKEDSPEGIRIDRYICDEEGVIPRSRLKQRNPRFFLNGKEVKASCRVRVHDRLELLYDEEREPNFGPEEMELDILFENHRVIVINKAQGMVVHPATGSWSGTLVQGLLHHCSNLGQSFEGEMIRPGIVHRLDKETSGVIIAAKDPDARDFLARQFAERRVVKRYIALVKGAVSSPSGRIESGIIRDPDNRKRFTWTESRSKGKWAVTEYKRIAFCRELSLLSVALLTGRTHQIRVHSLMMGHPIIGDSIYSRRSGLIPEESGLMLHAMKLAVTLPDEKEPRTFLAPLAKRFYAPLQEFLNLDPETVNPD
jgi:23S rRNA pseudouridine1911/1915/1917 synthase